MSDSLQDYYAQFGISSFGDQPLGQLAQSATQNMQSQQKSNWNALPEYTLPAGASITPSAKGSYWSITDPATGLNKYLTSVGTGAGLQNWDSLGPTSIGGQYGKREGDGTWMANFTGAPQYRINGALPGVNSTPGELQSYYLSDTAPQEKFFKDEPEESVFSQLMGGNNSDLPWYIPKGSPMIFVGGALGAAASAMGGAAGAMGQTGSPLGGVEASSALGGSASGLGGNALSFSDALAHFTPSWAKGLVNAGNSPGITGGSFNLSDWWKNLGTSSGVGDMGQSFPGLEGMSGYDFAGNSGGSDWGTNPTGGGMDDEMGGFWDFLGGGGGGDNNFLMPPADPSGMNPNMLETGTPNWNPSRPEASLLQTLQSLVQDTGMSTKDALSLLGKLGAAGLGAYASSKQSGALSGLAGQYAEMGAPYRAMLASSYANPNAFLANDPGIQASVNQGTNALARALSVRGNPAGNATALQEIQNYATQGLYGGLGNERNRLANFGGLSSFNAAAPQAATQSIGSNANLYNALGYGLQQATAPSTPSLADLYKSLNLGGLT